MDTGDLEVVVLSGKPRERGRIHGETLRSRVRDMAGRWEAELERANAMAPDLFVREFLAATRFEPAIERFTPGLLDEVRGLAEAAGLSYETAFAMQLIDEAWWYGRYRRFGVCADDPERCSSLGIAAYGDVPTLVAQNLDLAPWMDGMQVLFRIESEGAKPDQLLLSQAGTIVLNGMNGHGVGVCVNSVLQLNSRVDGLPVPFVIRGMLEQSDLDGVERFLRRVDHASGQNYTIGDGRAVAAFECSGNQVSRYQPASRFRPAGDASVVYHTNHPLVNQDQAIEAKISAKAPPEDHVSRPGNSQQRLAALAKHFDVADGKSITVADVKSALAEPPLSRPGNDSEGNSIISYTAASTIFELGETPGLHLASGPPCSTPFRTFDFGEAS